MKKLILLSLTLLSVLLSSCSGSKVQIKPEQSQTEVIRKDTILPTPKKLFSEQPQEMTTDTVVIPKRKKSEKQQQIILAPIILPVTTTPILQMPEQKLDKLTTEEKPKSVVETQPPKIEQVEKEYKPIETPKVVEKEYKPIEVPKISKPVEIVEYSIQIGAFITENSANEHLKNFKKFFPSKNAFILFDSISGFYKVRVNNIKDTVELEEILLSIRENFPDAFIVSNISKPKQEVKPQFIELSDIVKIQIGVYSEFSRAMEIKDYVESKFNIKSEIIKSGKLYKVIVYMNKGDENALNAIKLEFPDAFVTK